MFLAGENWLNKAYFHKYAWDGYPWYYKTPLSMMSIQSRVTVVGDGVRSENLEHTPHFSAPFFGLVLPWMILPWVPLVRVYNYLKYLFTLSQHMNNVCAIKFHWFVDMIFTLGCHWCQRVLSSVIVFVHLSILLSVSNNVPALTSYQPQIWWDDAQYQGADHFKIWLWVANFCTFHRTLKTSMIGFFDWVWGMTFLL